jgi:Beta-galactosidase
VVAVLRDAHEHGALPVAWETIEPEEGKFNFTVADGLLEDARANKVRGDRAGVDCNPLDLLGQMVSR